MSNQKTGTIIFYDPQRGFGFIEPLTHDPQKEKLFFHVADQSADFKRRENELTGATVAFDRAPNIRAKYPWKAINTRLIDAVAA
jgi:cold shock CspA family protein